MRPALLLGVPGLLALWGLVTLVPLVRPWVWPVEVTVQLRPLGRAPAPLAAPPGPWRLVQAAVVQRTPVEGFSVGDAVVFDRYGTLAPAPGSVLCTWLVPGHRPVQITPIGGATHYAGAVSLTVDPDPAGCPEP